MKKALLLWAASGVLGVFVGVVSSQAACISGGAVDEIGDCIAVNQGSNDCLVGFAVDYDGSGNPPLDSGGNPSTKIECVDGAACDGDGAVNGVCAFQFGMCLNAATGSCTAATLTDLTIGKPSQSDIDKKSVKNPQAFYTRRTINDEGTPLLGASEACSADDLALRVPLKRSKGTCDSPAGLKCSSDQDCDTFCQPALKKAKATVKVDVSDGASRFDSDSLKFTCLPSTATSGCPTTAFQVTNPADLIGGPVAQGRVNDWMLNNGSIRVLLKNSQRDHSFMVTYGGHVMDADLVRDDPADDRDNWIGMQTLVNIASTQNTQNIFPLNDGTDCQAGILRTEGEDDLFDVLSPDLAIYSAGDTLSVGASDTEVDLNHTGVDLPNVDLQTDYVLRPDTNYVQISTTVINNGTEDLELYIGDFLNPGGHLEVFGPGMGYGEPQLRLGGSGSDSSPQGLDFIAGQGTGDARGVTYGVVFPETELFGEPTDDTFFTSAFGQSGVFVWAHNTNLIGLLNSTQPKNPGPLLVLSGGGESTFRRWFVVGDTIADVTKAREEIFGRKLGIIQGVVTSLGDGSPIPDAHVTVLRTDRGPGTGGNRCANAGGDNCQNVYSGTLTDTGGFYRFFLPAGDYKVVVRAGGVPYEGSLPEPTEHLVTVKANGTVTTNLELPTTGQLQVFVKNQSSSAIAGKVSVVGFEESADPLNTDNIGFGIVNIGRYFGYDPAEKDVSTFGIAKVVWVDQSGDSGVVDLEPGDYNIVVSHGPEYDIYNERVTITAGATTTVNATVRQVVDTTGFVSIDTHVHSVPSSDSAVTRRDRIVSMLAEGVDFFVTSDHDVVVDFSGDVSAMGAGLLVSTAPSAETTTFSYGHFNMWPQTVNPASIIGGALDWGRSGVTPGLDYPEHFSYDLLPSEIFGAFDPANQVIQINHFNSGTLGHFNNLAIDTVATPPESGNNVFRCDGGPRKDLPCTAVCFGGDFPLATCKQATAAIDCPNGGVCQESLGRDCPGAGNECVDVVANLGSFLRLDPAETNLFDDGFTALELWIEADPPQTALALGDNLADWAGLLNQGLFKAGVADSDTHKRVIVQAGSPRTFVASATDAPGSLNATTLAQTVNAGRAIGSGGIFMRVELEGDLSATASHAIGDPLTVDAAGGGLDLVNIHIESPTWAEFDTVDIYANSAPNCVDEFTFFGVLNPTCTVAPLATKVASPPYGTGTDFTISPTTGVSGSGTRLVANLSVPLTITSDTWVVVVARGTQPSSAPLFPVMPQGLATGGNLTLDGLTDYPSVPPWNDTQAGQRAMAFSNPLFFDFEHDGLCHGGVTCP
jgi:hypothetical protein